MQSYALLAITLIVIAALLLPRLHVEPSDPEPAYHTLNSSNMSTIRGLCAFWLMVGQIGQVTGDEGLSFLGQLSALPIGIFFMISGYELMSTMKERIASKPLAFTRQVITIWIISVTTILLGLLVGMGVQGINWYVIEITVLIAVTLLVLNILGLRALIMALFVVLLAAVVGAALLGANPMWFGSTLCFPLGLFVGLTREKIHALAGRAYVVCLLLAFVVTLVTAGSLFLIPTDYQLWASLASNLASASFSFLCLLVMHRVEFRSRLAVALGTFSFEVFLIHIVFVGRFSFIHNTYLYCAAVMGVTLLISYIMHKLNAAIRTFSLQHLPG